MSSFHKKGGCMTWYNKLAEFNVESLFSRRKPLGPPRTIFINESLPLEYFDDKGRPRKEHVYATNQVITSKYTIITFFPRNLLEQFRRIANIFFLGIAILQFFSKFSTISPGLVILPLLVVLSFTAVKDGWEDIKRHQSDRRVNHSTVRVLGGWVNPNFMGEKSRTFIRGLVHRRPRNVISNPGDVEMDLIDHPLPRDPALEPRLDDASMQDDIDGQAETDRPPHWKKTLWEDLRVGDFVKILNNSSIPADILICATSDPENVAFVETKNLDGETNLKSRNALPALTHLRTAADCADRKNAFRVECDRPSENMFKLQAALNSGGHKHSIDINMTLLRGTVLRNTEWVIGIVLFTGEDSKIILNSGGTPSKQSKVERQMNPQVFLNLIILALMATACGIVDSVLEHKQFPQGAPWLYGDNQANDNPSINGLVTWAFALITFQNIVPISLYISIEFVRTCQAAFIYFDKAIWYEKTDQPTLARSWNLSDDLGQIQYIFSDKTGTLTQNSMVFRRCSIGGKIYSGDPDLNTERADTSDATVIPVGTKPEPSRPEFDAGPVVEAGMSSQTVTMPDEGEISASPTTLSAGQLKLSKGVLHHFHDAELSRDLASVVDMTPENESLARALNGFFVVLALCHTVLTAVDPETGAIEYKAQSPDEAALVQAAADIGFVFRGRDKEILSLQTPFSEEVEKYELLDILDFTSARKRMSVVVRKLQGNDSRLFLLTKGADNVIFERLKAGADLLKEKTGSHLDEFASEGLRTLTLAYKVISEAEYETWSRRYQEASVALEDRDQKIEEVCNELEQDLRLLGATAIEDRLQDGVPETIADLKRAGIKIWVATGDKLETAIAIGHSTNLIGRDSNIIVVRGGGSRSVYDQMANALEEFFPEHGLLAGLNEKGKAVQPRAAIPSQSVSEDRHGLHRVDTGVSSIVGADNGNRPGGFVLVIDGAALSTALADDEHKRLLLSLGTQCEGVICCRVSPLQKALVVKLVKDNLGVMTLAIGDGANDVSMIQAADVGVGISGEEGLQAVNASDYAIGQFRFLKRLLLVHGHWSYARNGNMILNFFYKNIVCIGVLWWFQIYCAWSSEFVFEYTFLLFWNSFWTIAPVIGIGLFDRIVDDRILMDVPELYHHGREGYWFGMGSFVVYMLDGIYQSAIIFFLVLFTYVSTTAREDGYDITQFEFSTTMVFAAVLAANLFNGLNTNVWTIWVFFAVWIGTVLLFIFAVVYSLISPGWFVTDIFGYYKIWFPSAFFWLCLPLTVCFSLLPRYLGKAWRFGFAPDDLATLRYIHMMQPHRDVGSEVRSGEARSLAALRWLHTASNGDVTSRRPSLELQPPRPASSSRTDMATGLTSCYRGFDFAAEEGGVAMQRMQSNLSERRQSSRNLATVQEDTRRRSSTLWSLKGLRKKKPPTPPGSMS